MGVFANKEFPVHIKNNRDHLWPIFQLAKSLTEYHDKCKMDNDRLIINGTPYGVNDIPNLPQDLAAYKAAEKSNDTHIVFAGELSPYSNFH